MNYTLLPTNATVYTAPPELLSHGAALAIAAAIFAAFMAVGIVAILGCYLCACACERPAAPDTSGCRDMMVCRMFSFCGFWCYVKCCRRSKRYLDRVMNRGRRMMDDMELDLENQLMQELVEMNPEDEERAPSDEEKKEDLLDFEVLDSTAVLKPEVKRD